MRIVCLGCSITAGYGVSREESWVELLSVMTGHLWINAGICGDTTGGMLARLDKSVFSHNPDAALIMGGTNDILSCGSWECAKPNIMAMVHQCVSRGVKPIIGVPLPISPYAPSSYKSFLDIKAASVQMSFYSEWLRLFASELRLRTVDFGSSYEKFAKTFGWDRAYFSDGLHPTAEGHIVMAKTAADKKFFRVTDRSSVSEQAAE